MREDSHSTTALSVALRRAAHQLYDDKPAVLDDPYIVPLLERRYADHLRRTPSARGVKRPYSSDIRAWVVARSRFAEDTLAEQPRCEQALVLGAGLETFSLRNRNPSLRIFEVDHPATLLWKQDLLREAGLTLPPEAVQVGMDFESRASLQERLMQAGFRWTAITAVTWLGVVMYLTRPGFDEAMRSLGALPPESTLTLDYYQPREALPPREQLMLDSLMQRVAQAGEPFRLFFTPPQISSRLADSSFEVVADLGAEELNARYFTHRTDDLRLHSSTARLLYAVKRQ